MGRRFECAEALSVDTCSMLLLPSHWRTRYGTECAKLWCKLGGRRAPCRWRSPSQSDRAMSLFSFQRVVRTCWLLGFIFGGPAAAETARPQTMTSDGVP